MRLAFMGTAAFAVPSLEALVSARHTVTAVVTQPDVERVIEQGRAVTEEAEPRGAERLLAQDRPFVVRELNVQLLQTLLRAT